MKIFSKLIPSAKEDKTPSETQTPTAQASVSISEISFNDGTLLRLDPDELLILVGPNNSGKTRTLKEIQRCLSGMQHIIISDIKLSKTGDVPSVQTWMDRHYIIEKPYGWYVTVGEHISPDAIERAWREPHALGDLTPFFIKLTSTDARLSASRPADSIDVLTDPPKAPMHNIASDPEIEQRLSEATQAAFQIPIFLDRWSGKQIAIIEARIIG